MAFLRQGTANGRRPAWALKLDVASFFPSLHKATLYGVLAVRLTTGRQDEAEGAHWPVAI